MNKIQIEYTNIQAAGCVFFTTGAKYFMCFYSAVFRSCHCNTVPVTFVWLMQPCSPRCHFKVHGSKFYGYRKYLPWWSGRLQSSLCSEITIFVRGTKTIIGWNCKSLYFLTLIVCYICGPQHVSTHKTALIGWGQLGNKNPPWHLPPYKKNIMDSKSYLK